MTKHTPGPWVVGLTIGSPHVSPEGPWGWYQTDIEGPQGEGCFLELRQYHGGETRDANAHLIAAAPEMYEALKYALRMMPPSADFSMLHRALDKAEGRG